MKRSQRTSSKCLIWLTFIFFAFSANLGYGQEPGQILDKTSEVQVPASESFKLVSDTLASPWRDSGCNRQARSFRTNGCKPVTGQEWASATFMTLYNDDGSIWYQFSLSPDYTGKDLTDRQRDFKPYSIPNVMATLVILRVSAESEHWFKVEVNEESGLVKYISKRDRMWSTTTYAFWLAESGRITFREAHLRKQPGGEVIDDSSAGPLEDAFVKKIQGDWVFVQGARKGQESIQGWMKWKDGRQVLVGWMLNLWKIP